MFFEGNSCLLRGYFLIKLTFLLAKPSNAQGTQRIMSQKFGEFGSDLEPAFLRIESKCNCQLSLVTNSDSGVPLGA